MTELDETKFWVALTKLEATTAESQKHINQQLEILAKAQLETETKLRELITVVHDLGVIVASHERRLSEMEQS